MQKGVVVVVSAAAAVLGLAVAVLGVAAEVTMSQPLVGPGGFRCEYPRTPAFDCGVAAAALSLTGVALVTAASGCFGRCAAWRWRGRCTCSLITIKVLPVVAWGLTVLSTSSFQYGASRNAGGTGAFSPVRRGQGSGAWTSFEFRCTGLRRGAFASASIASAVAIACAIAAYVELQKTDQPFGGQSIAMGQPQPYPPPPVAYPAPPAYGGYYGDKQPAGTA